MRDTLAVGLNEVLRAVMAGSVAVSGAVLARTFRRRVRNYKRDQAALARRYGITPEVPIRTYDEAVGEAVEAYAAQNTGAEFAYTSGSTSTPKKIAFTKARLRAIKSANFSVAARMAPRLAMPRLGLVILAGLSEDDSLTALIIRDRTRQPAYGAGVLLPAKYLATPAVSALVDEYGATAMRLWLLALANPGIVYSTNPSTLALFLSEVHDDWPGSTRFIRDWLADPGAFDPAVRSTQRRVAGRGWRRRLQRIAAADAPIPVAEMVPGFRLYCCWDGGYVRPFIDRIKAFLPEDRFTLVPMYSMSTETVETLNYFDGDVIRFLPIADGVLYEFLPEHAPDDPALLLRADELEPGHTYAMVVSDAYGLRRYQTEDLFECMAKVGDAPDLHFRRRRGLAFSFTGEKITDSHVVAAFTALRDAFPVLRGEGVQLALIPTQPEDVLAPGYRLVLAHPSRSAPDALVAAASDLAVAFDAALSEQNREFGAKIESQRLASTRTAVMHYDHLAATLDPKTEEADAGRRGWDTQFKLLPLYRTLWQDYGFDT